MNNRHHTAILEFEIIKPIEGDPFEKTGEILALTFFGEYCPKGYALARAYRLSELLTHPDNYKAIRILEQGKLKLL
ncbi:MAG: hypothetical protein WCO63_01205 [Bacteroidota bacterium]